jgi:drug/metabolite transporter (DMT)-like permease
MTDASDKPLLVPTDGGSSGKDEPEVKGCRKYCQGKNALVLGYSIGLLCAALGNSIFFKRMTNHMPNYPYFITQMSTLVYVPIFFGVVAYEMKFTNYITKEMTDFPKRKFVWMGLFDSLAGILMVFGGVRTSGSTQALLLNAIIPMTMFLSYVFLKARYKWLQYIGATTIITGVVVVILPTVINKSSDDTSDSPLFNLLFLLSTLPQAMSGVYKEIAFNDADIDVNYLQAWVAISQLFIGFALIPLTTFKFLGANAMPWGSLLSAISNGAICLAGYNSVVPESSTCSFEANAALPCDDCAGAWIPLCLYLFFNCFYNVFIVLVIKYGSAALMYIVMTLRLPLIQIAFSLEFVQNPPDAFQWYSIVGLFLILGGLVAYRWVSATTAAAPASATATGSAATSNSDTLSAEDVLGGSASASSSNNTLNDEDEVTMVLPSVSGNHLATGTLHRRQKSSKPPNRDAGSLRHGLYRSLGVIERAEAAASAAAAAQIPSDHSTANSLGSYHSIRPSTASPGNARREEIRRQVSNKQLSMEMPSSPSNPSNVPRAPSQHASIAIRANPTDDG